MVFKKGQAPPRKQVQQRQAPVRKLREHPIIEHFNHQGDTLDMMGNLADEFSASCDKVSGMLF